MMPYLLTGLAGIALGIVAMRVWQARGPTEIAVGADTDAAAPDAPPASIDFPDWSKQAVAGNRSTGRHRAGNLALRPGDQGGSEAATKPLPTLPGSGSQQALDDADTSQINLARRAA